MPTVFSCVASRNKRVARLRWARWSYPICILNASLRFVEPRGPDASPSGGPQTHYVCCIPPRRPTHLKAQHPFTAQKYRIRSQPNICSPPAVSATSSGELQSAAGSGGELRGSKSRRSIALGPANGTAQSSPKSTAQFSAPCPPHCGSAIAPPRFRAPCAIHLYSARRRNS